MSNEIQRNRKFDLTYCDYYVSDLLDIYGSKSDRQKEFSTSEFNPSSLRTHIL